jgi:hypothetical protein
VLLQLPEPVAEQEVILVLPDIDDDEDDGFVEHALSAIRSLDPLQQQPIDEREDAPTVRLPGLIPLLPITFGAFVLSSLSFLSLILYASSGPRDYTIPFAVSQAVFLGLLWFYHLGYRTRRRFLAFRQMLLIVLLTGFMVLVMLDMMRHPPSPTAELFWLRLGLVCQGSCGIAIFTHWAVLGRGSREVLRERFGHKKSPSTGSSKR